MAMNTMPDSAAARAGISFSSGKRFKNAALQIEINSNYDKVLSFLNNIE